MNRRLAILIAVGLSIVGSIVGLCVGHFALSGCSKPPLCVDDAQVRAVVDETEFAGARVHSYGAVFWPSVQTELQDAGLWIRISRAGREEYLLVVVSGVNGRHWAAARAYGQGAGFEWYRAFPERPSPDDVTEFIRGVPAERLSPAYDTCTQLEDLKACGGAPVRPGHAGQK